MDINAVKLSAIIAKAKKGVTFPQELFVKYKQTKFDQEQKSFLFRKDSSGLYMDFLATLLRETDAKLIVELGNYYGNSTIALYHGLKANQKLISLDIMKDQRYIPQQIYDDKRVKIIVGDALDLNSYPRAGIPIPVDIDIFWSDTVHIYSQIRDEFYIYEPLLAEKAVFVYDDVNLNDKKRLFDSLTGFKINDTQLHAHGYCVSIIERSAKFSAMSKEERIRESCLRAIQVFAKKYNDLNESDKKLFARLLDMKSDKVYEFVRSILGRKQN